MDDERTEIEFDRTNYKQNFRQYSINREDFVHIPIESIYEISD